MKKHYIYFVFLAGLLCSGACRKFVEIDPPDTQLVASTVFESDATANSALVTAYAFMVTQTANPFIISLYSGLAADELKTSSTGSTLQNMYKNNLLPLDAPTTSIWNGGFNIIYQANAVIEGCTSSSSMSTAVKKQDIAEATFLRAFWHFNLVNFFGKIPYVITTNYEKNKDLKQLDKEDVYQLIVKDLLAAQSALSENYVDKTSINTSTERIRANKAAATALLARTYLYMKMYTEAEQEATKIIDDNSTYSIVGLDDVFKANSLEAIFQLMTPQPSFNNTTEGSGYILTSRPSSGGSRTATISSSLYNSFEDGDLRKEKWIGTVSSSGNSYRFPYKYKVASGSAYIQEHSMVLRLAEQFLIRAEARAMLNNLSGSIADLDIIRERAGLPLIAETNSGIDKDELLNLILSERRLELFTEWGHRWLDLKRSGKIDAVMSNEAAVKGGSWSSYKQYFPIPQKEIDNNRNLVQNDGYPK